jgi:hypothetical protein
MAYDCKNVIMILRKITESCKMQDTSELKLSSFRVCNIT